jgi:hypothetical protein
MQAHTPYSYKHLWNTKLDWQISKLMIWYTRVSCSRFYTGKSTWRDHIMPMAWLNHTNSSGVTSVHSTPHTCMEFHGCWWVTPWVLAWQNALLPKKLAAGGLLLKNTSFLRAKKNSCMYFLLEKSVQGDNWPGLVPRIFYKIFQILRHIESLTHGWSIKYG